MTKIFKSAIALVCTAAVSLNGFAQKSVPNDWHLTDPGTSGYYGISLNKAYDFLKNKKSNKVIVAVIDSGIDTTHEDLKPVLWKNPKEIPGNGIDDDKNGYVDDVHGWNFLGGKDGRNVKEDSYEAARVYHRYKARFENVNPATLSKADKALYEMWSKAGASIEGDPTASLNLMFINNAYKTAVSADTTLQRVMGKEVFTSAEVEKFSAVTEDAKSARKKFLQIFQMLGIESNRTNKEVLGEIGDYVAAEQRKADAKNTPPANYRADIVKDNEADINDRFYGNNDIMASTPDHGTHVSGIIAAARNGKGVDGIANNVEIMTLRAVPDGDEHDKDVALAIRYAVDHGAKVINMSFGKGFSPEKSWVDEAVKYAESKGVLLVHAAGNDAANIDTTWNFPSPVFAADGYRATNWLTVGATGANKNTLVANFSNYGKTEVDVFAPGVNIYSTIPGGNTYRSMSGTSMASPVVAGVAALILQYYPQFTPAQVKAIIENSAIPFTEKVTNPNTNAKVDLSDISRTGGVVNAFTAVLVADELARTGKFKTDSKKIKVDGKELKIKNEKTDTKKKVKSA